METVKRGIKVMPHSDRENCNSCLDEEENERIPGCFGCLQKRLHILPIVTFIWVVISIFLSYTLAAINGHTETGFPYISKTANDDPQRSIFGQMVNIGAVLLGLCCAVRYLYVKEALLETSAPISLHWCNLVSFSVGTAICIGISMLGNFPTDVHKVPHYIGAIVAFVGGVVYSWIQFRLSWFLLKKRICQRYVPYIQLALSTCSTVLCILFGISKLIFKVLESTGTGTKEGSLRGVYLVSTVSEWCLVLSIAAFFLTFTPDLKTSVLKAPRVLLDRELIQTADQNGKSYGALTEISSESPAYSHS